VAQGAEEAEPERRKHDRLFCQKRKEVESHRLIAVEETVNEKGF